MFLLHWHLLVTLQFSTRFYTLLQFSTHFCSSLHASAVLYTLSSLTQRLTLSPGCPALDASSPHSASVNEGTRWFPGAHGGHFSDPFDQSSKEALLSVPRQPWPRPAACLPWAISSCRFASPSAENRSSLILVSALRLFSRCCVLSCMAERADINTSVSFSFSLYFRSSYQYHQSSNVTRQFWHWCLQISLKSQIKSHHYWPGH